MSKHLLKYIIQSAILSYGMVAFKFWELNPASWPDERRAGLVIIFFLWLILHYLLDEILTQ